MEHITVIECKNKRSVGNKQKNHLLNLLNRKNYIEDIDYSGMEDIDPRLKSTEQTEQTEQAEQTEQTERTNQSHRLNATEYNNIEIDIDLIANNLSKSIKKKSYRNPKNILHHLSVKIDKNKKLLTLLVSNVSDNLKYSDPILNRVLHQSCVIVFDIDTYYPLFSLENRINSSDISPIDRENSYLNKHLYSVMESYRNSEFDHNKVECYKNHIGSYIVIFYNNGNWLFFFSGKTYELCIEKHAVLYEHISDHIDKLDKNYCYHIILIDPRLRIPLQSPCDSSYMILIKINEIHSLQEYGIDHPSVPENLFVEDKRIFLSCIDQLDLYLEEMNNVNTKNKKLYNRGLIVKVKVDQFEPIHIIYDTYTYKRLDDMMPHDMTIHEAHMHLYQTDRLNNVLQYVDDPDNAGLIVTRINLAIVTMGREILDIYHYTRNKENPELFELLSSAYRDIMHNLHGQFISKKNRKVHNKDGCGDGEKVSITTEDVYMTLKNMDTLALSELFVDREQLKDKIDQNKHKLMDRTIEIIKNCNSTSLQTRLLM
jgi:hypothetical protein